MVQGASGSASGGQLEEKVDLSAETDAKIAQAQQLVTQQTTSDGGSGNQQHQQQQQLKDALLLLAALEKRCRVGNDTPSLVRVCQASLELCHTAKDNEALLTTLESLANRRSQKTAAVKALVHTAMPYCMIEPYEPLAVSDDDDAVTAQPVRDQLVEALRAITDGKIYLERERAQLTRVLATIKEQGGDVSGAADTLQEVHVETYGSLSKKEKVEFILEQMRLTLAKQDYVRAAIVAGKINRKQLMEDSMENYKVQFFQLITQYHRHDQDALELAKDYHAIYLTPHILADEAKWMEALRATVLFLALSPWGNEQQDMLHRVKRDSNLEKLPSYESLIQLLLKKEIINYPLAQQAELESLEVFKEGGGGGDLAKHWHDMFHRRIIQHNVRVVALYYQNIHGSRLAQLLQLEPARLEQEIASMVSDGSVYAKIDRPKDIVRFSAPKGPEAILSDWAGNIDKLLNMVETTTHLINKENMTKQ